MLNISMLALFCFDCFYSCCCRTFYTLIFISSVFVLLYSCLYLVSTLIFFLTCLWILLLHLPCNLKSRPPLKPLWMTVISLFFHFLSIKMVEWRNSDSSVQLLDSSARNLLEMSLFLLSQLCKSWEACSRFVYRLALNAPWQHTDKSESVFTFSHWWSTSLHNFTTPLDFCLAFILTV